MKTQTKDICDRVLITTPILETWPLSEDRVLFLGAWCKTYNNKYIFENYDHKVVDYHWDNNAKFNLDYEKINEIYENLLIILSDNLNKIHSVNHSYYYWRIIIGPWLGIFCQIVYDRWYSIKETFEKYKISKTIFLKTNQEDQISNDFNKFISSDISSDLWNHQIYREIIELINYDCEFTYIKLKDTQKSNKINLKYEISKFKSSIIRFFKQFSTFGANQDKYFIIHSCLTPFREIDLQFRLGQFPRLWNRKKIPSLKTNFKKRKQLIISQSNFKNNELKQYKEIILTLIPKFLPKSYLEGYEFLSSKKLIKNWPDSPSTIFTSGSIISDDIFKIWSAFHIEKGARLFLGQHGGHYGTSKISFLEDHQKIISNKFFYWGAINHSNKLDKKVENIGLFISDFHSLKIKSKKNGNLLILKNVVPRYSYWMWSCIKNAGHWEEYFKFNCEFVKSLPKRIREKTEVRIYPKADYYYEQAKRWKEELKEIKIDYAKTTLQKKLKNTRVCVSTTNSTTLLITMAINFPTIILWDPNYWDLKEEALIYFNELERVGIFQKNYKSAQKHILKIWDNVDNWWLNDDTQKSRINFCNQYAKIEENDIPLLAKFIS